MLAKTHISADPYLRERLDPRPGDPHYLHLSDLLLALRRVRPEQAGRVLDFGCGGSPYRELFSGEIYHRADFPGFADLDFEFGEDSAIATPDAGYDLVLSTQVLEHVREPARYLAECARLLRPGGRLILSTHGLFEEHGCPYDFQRWTADGLRLAIERSGLQVRRTFKLTSGARALFFFARHLHPVLITGDHSWLGWGLRLVKRILHRRPQAVDRFCDRAFPADARVHEVTATSAGSSVYIALVIEAVKPVR